MQKCEGIYIEDLQGRCYMDNFHPVGFANPEVIAREKLDVAEDRALDIIEECLAEIEI